MQYGIVLLACVYKLSFADASWCQSFICLCCFCCSFVLMSSPYSSPSPSSDGLPGHNSGSSPSPLPRVSESPLVDSATSPSLPISSAHGFSSFSDALRRGVGNPNSGVDIPSSRSLEPPPFSSNPTLVGNHPLTNTDPSGSAEPVVPPIGTIPPLAKLTSMCLLAKIWGESVPLPFIVSKTKLD